MNDQRFQASDAANVDFPARKHRKSAGAPWCRHRARMQDDRLFPAKNQREDWSRNRWRMVDRSSLGGATFCPFPVCIDHKLCVLREPQEVATVAVCNWSHGVDESSFAGCQR